MSTPLAATLRRRIRQARRRLTAAAVAQGVLLTAGVVGAVVLVAVAAEAGFWLGVELRTAVFWLLAALLAGMTAVLVVVPLLRGAGVLPGLDERAVVRRAGRDYAGVDDRLSTFLDLADGRSSGGSRLHEAALDALGREVQDVPFERVHAFGPAWRTARWAAVPALLLAALFLGAPSTVGGAAARLMAPGVYFAPPAPFRLDVAPGDAAVARGASLPVTVNAVGRELPLTAEIEVGRADERATETVRLTADEGGAFAYTVEDVRADMRYRVLADGVRTEWFEVTVENRPLVRGVQVTVAPPGYSGRRARRLPEGVGDVTGLVGSGVRVRVALGGTRPAQAWLEVRWEDGRAQRVPLKVSGDEANGGFRLRGGGTYSVRLKAKNGLENTDPATYSLGTLSDGPPQIALVEGAESPLSGAARRLAFRVTDDFGFSGGAVVYRVAASEGGAAGPLRRLPLPVRTRPLDQEVSLDLRLPGVRPGAVVEFYGLVRDNDGRGGKTARTPSFTLRYPTLSDRLDAFDADRDSTAEALEDLQENAVESGERFRRLRDDLRQSLDPDWEDRRQVEELLREQSDMQDQAQDLQEQMRRLSEQLQRQDLTDEATQRQFEMMQRVMDELDSPELRDALERLQEAMEKLDLQDMLQESEEAAQSEEEFRRRLERAMELMKRLEAAVEMEEAARRAEDLAETEERLARETEAMREDRPAPDKDGEPTPAPPEHAGRAAEAGRGAAAGGRGRRGPGAADGRRPRGPGGDGPGAFWRDAGDDGADAAGRRSPAADGAERAELQQNQLQKAQEGQQDLAKKLRRLAEQMREQSGQMQGQQAQVDQAAVRRALEDVLTLSREQERLANETDRIPARNPALVPVARRQGELRDGLAAVADTLRRVAKSVPQLGPEVDERAGNARREMAGALEQLAERQSRPGAARQRAAMSHLNELALLLSDLLDQLQNQSQQQGSGGQGMPQKMQQIGQQQQRLNQRIQQMLNESAGERLSPEEGRRMRQLGEQQEALRRQLQRAIEGGGEGLGPGDRSALKRVEDQMREAAQDLRRGRPDRRIAPRQQQILEKLLEAEESVNQRGREEKREAQTGRDRPDPDRPVPPRTERPAERVRRDLIRALESGYSSDYQDLIKRYFERLQQRTGG